MLVYIIKFIFNQPNDIVNNFQEKKDDNNIFRINLNLYFNNLIIF